MNNKNQYIVHQNYDTPPKLFGVFNYTTIIISAIIVLPIIFITSKLNITINIKIYVIFLTIFPAILINFIFANSNNIYITFLFIIKYLFSNKVFIYMKDTKN